MVKCACGKERGENEFFDDCDQCEELFCNTCEYRLFDKDVWVLSYCKACGEEHKRAQVGFALAHEVEMAMLDNEMGGETCQVEEFFMESC